MAQALPIARDASRPQQLWQDYGSDLVVVSALLMLFVLSVRLCGRDGSPTGWRAPVPSRQAPCLMLAVGPRARLIRAGVCPILRSSSLVGSEAIRSILGIGQLLDTHPHQRGDHHKRVIVRSLADAGRRSAWRG